MVAIPANAGESRCESTTDIATRVDFDKQATGWFSTHWVNDTFPIECGFNEMSGHAVFSAATQSMFLGMTGQNALIGINPIL